jgi:predicted dehydrogenase
MIFARLGEPRQILTRGGAGLGDGADRWTRVPPGHPEGYLEGFANLYQDIAAVLMGEPGYSDLPSLEAGMDGMWFITACQDSARNDASWVSRDSHAS